MKPSQLPVVDLSDPPPSWPTGKRVVLLVPGEDAVVLDFEMPASVRRGAADRIMFYSVQDVVSEEMVDIHLVRLPSERDAAPDRRKAIVTSRVRMSAWLEQVNHAGAQLAAMVPDYLALPWEPGGWTVKVESDRLRARFGRFDGFAAEAELGVSILERRWKDTPTAPERIRLLVEPATTQHAMAALLAWLDATGISASPEILPAGVPQLRHGELDANLIVGAFSESLTLLQEIARWRLPLGLAAAALLAWAFDVGLALREERAEIERLDRRIEEIFRAEFVPAGPIVNLRIQTARSLEALRARSATPREASSFLALLAASGETLPEGARRISRLSYRDHVLTAEVTLADFRTLETLETALANNRLTVEVESSTASGDEGVDATLNLRAGERL